VQSVIVVLGLVLFEVISSIDNAIVNAHVLKTLPHKYRRFFLIWGLLLAVFVMRGVLPFVIVWLANLHLGLFETVRLAFTDPVAMEESLHHSKPLLLIGGGVYLVFVFLAWLFVEEKNYAFFVERIVHRQSVWFFAVASIFITVVIWGCLQVNPEMALAASLGSTVFFIGDGFRRNAEETEVQLQGPSMSAWSKVLYLEVLDASFSIDGVVGAFAFTMSVPLILVGNGIGAFVVREVTVRGIDVVSRFAYLKNGAMYSIGVLGSIMCVEAFGPEPAFWVAPLTTVTLLVVFLGMSVRELWVSKVL
jgi:hypothetical protein